MIRTLAALAAAVSLTALATPALAQATAATGDWGAFGVQTQYLDTSVKPGDDFDGYVNGGWLRRTEIPADRATWGSFVELDELSEQRVHTILEEIAARHPDPATAEGKIAAAYTAFMDTAAIERAGLAPAEPFLARIEAARTPADLLTLFAQPGFASPLDIAVEPDAKQTDQYAVYLSQGALGLPDRDNYLVDTPRNLELRVKYRDYLTFLLGKAGYSDPRAAAESVVALETRLAAAKWDRALSRNPNLTYNKMGVEELAAAAPKAPLARFMQALGAAPVKTIVVAELPPTPQELAAEHITPAMAAKLGGGVPATLRLIADQPIDAWRAWLAARFLSDHAAMLPREIDDARFAFYGRALSGQPEQRARWKRAIDAVEGEVGELLGKVYAERWFPAESRAAMADLVANLRKAMAANLADLKWMGPATRQEAQAKLAAFTPKIGAPEVYKTYAGLTLDPANPLGNEVAAARWTLAYDLARLGKPIDRKEWHMFPQMVNAYYNPLQNEIVFPAAVLQPPFFNPAADPAVNYGAIGAVIGHEMGHGYDDQGSKFDPSGNLRNWWTPADRAAFDKLTARLAAQYAALCPFDEGKTCINGQLTLGENIGDLGGLSLAYRAYKLSLNGRPAPVIGGFTGDQRFFMGWAQVWRAKVREEDARRRLQVDPHSPPHYRINAIVRNFDEWHEAFGVRPGDKLYLPPEQRVRIW